MDAFLTSDGLLALVTLTAMEVVLGIDNVVFLALLVGRLPEERQALARRLGLTLALGIRIGLLFAISWMMGLTAPLFQVLGRAISSRDLILLAGGLFLIFKATWEIYDRLEVVHAQPGARGGRAAFLGVLIQILLLDIVFSLDSVITAVGMANRLSIMVTAMVLAMLVMLGSAGAVSGFVERHPSVKMLALAFLLLIGVMLVAEGMGTHVDKGYIYVAMAFSLFVEMLNLRYRKKRRPRLLHRRFEAGSTTTTAGPDAVRVRDLGTAEWVERGGARLKELAAHGKRLRLVEFGPGFSDPGWCLKGHVVYLLEGELESEYEDGISSRRAGEAYIIPAGVKHRSRNPHAVPAVLLIVDEGG